VALGVVEPCQLLEKFALYIGNARVSWFLLLDGLHMLIYRVHRVSLLIILLGLIDHGTIYGSRPASSLLSHFLW
jgi:hypothetical protein